MTYTWFGSRFSAPEMWIRQGLTMAITRPSLRNQRPVRNRRGSTSNSLIAPSSGTQSKIRAAVAAQIQAERSRRGIVKYMRLSKFLHSQRSGATHRRGPTLRRLPGHHSTWPPPARLRIPANGSYSRIGKALHDRAHRAGPQAEKDDRVSRRDGRARTGGGGASGAGRRGQAGADRRAAGECAGGRGVRGSGDLAAGEEVRHAVLRAPARQGDHAGGSGGGGEEAAVLRIADGGGGRCRRQRGRRGQQHGGDGARGAARGGCAPAGAAGVERLHHGAARSRAGA